MITKEDHPELTYLLECYYFQNWDEVYGNDWDAPIRNLVSTEKRDVLVAVRDDIDRFLTRDYSDEEWEQFVRPLSVGSMDPDFKEFLRDVRDIIDAHLKATAS